MSPSGRSIQLIAIPINLVSQGHGTNSARWYVHDGYQGLLEQHVNNMS
jgi:hypothetical protein